MRFKLAKSPTGKWFILVNPPHRPNSWILLLRNVMQTKGTQSAEINRNLAQDRYNRKRLAAYQKKQTRYLVEELFD